MRRGVGAGSSRSGVDRHRAAGSRCEPSDASHDRTTKPVMVPSCCGGRASFVAKRSIPAVSSRILTWVGALQPGLASGARASTKAVSSTVMSSISIVSWRSCSSRPCARRTTILVGSRSALLRLCGCGLARQWHVQPPSTQGIVQILGSGRSGKRGVDRDPLPLLGVAQPSAGRAREERRRERVHPYSPSAPLRGELTGEGGDHRGLGRGRSTAS